MYLNLKLGMIMNFHTGIYNINFLLVQVSEEKSLHEFGSYDHTTD